MIPQSQTAIEQTKEWLKQKAPDFVYETFMSLERALQKHVDAAALHEVLSTAYAELFEDAFECMGDLKDTDATRLTTRVQRISKIEGQAKELKNS